MKIQEAHVLVHPGFDAKVQVQGSLPNRIDNRRVLARLEGRWRKHLSKISHNPDSFLIYLSIVSFFKKRFFTALFHP